MMVDDPDLTLRQVRRLTVLQPDTNRSQRLRARAHAAFQQRRARLQPEAPGRPLERLIVEAGVGLSIGSLVTVLHDVVNVYLRR